MPFTFSHPAIVLPFTSFKKQLLSATGLIIGSMTPDFEYFVRMDVESHYSHTLLGLLWFDLPVGIILCFVYHGIIRNALIDHLPIFLRTRISVFKKFNWESFFKQNWPLVGLSILVGTASHLLWDGFTHRSGFFVKRISFLNENINVGSFTVPMFEIAQHVSTIIGGVVIILVVLNLEQMPVSKKTNIHKYWLLIIAITIAIIVLRLITGVSIYQYAILISTFMAGGIIALITTSLIFTNRLKKLIL